MLVVTTTNHPVDADVLYSRRIYISREPVCNYKGTECMRIPTPNVFFTKEIHKGPNFLDCNIFANNVWKADAAGYNVTPSYTQTFTVYLTSNNKQ